MKYTEIKAACGHILAENEIQDGAPGYAVQVKVVDRYVGRGIEHMRVCRECHAEMTKSGKALTDEQAAKWRRYED